MKIERAAKPVWSVGPARIAEALAPTLKEVDVELRHFETSESALEALGANSPSLMVAHGASMDAADQLESFFETLHHRRKEAFATIVMTEQSEASWRRRIFEAGADDWLLEPATDEAIRARLLGQLALFAPDRPAEGGGSKPPPTPEQGRRMSKLQAPISVLVCDDTPMIQRVLRSSFEREGWFVTEALDGREALEMIAEHDFDLAVFDLSLPFQNGFELLDQLDRIEASRRPCTVVLSAAKQQESVLRAFALGADDFVSKPVNPAILVARIRRLVEPTQSRRLDD